MKKVVHYDTARGVMQHHSGGVLLWPIDHPDSDHVSNASYVLTSKLMKQDLETGEFETENSLYAPDNRTVAQR